MSLSRAFLGLSSRSGSALGSKFSGRFVWVEIFFLKNLQRGLYQAIKSQFLEYFNPETGRVLHDQILF